MNGSPDPSRTGSGRFDTVGKVADVVNKIAVTLAILVAGGWALWRYLILESPSAQLEIDRVKRVCSEVGSLDIRIEPTSAGKVLLGKVVIKNIGSRAVLLDMQNESAPIIVSELKFPENDEATATIVAEPGFPYAYDSDPNNRLTLFSILPGRTLDLPFATVAPHEGIYLISFHGGPRKIEADAKECGNVKPDGTPYNWAASAIQQITFSPGISAPAGRR